MVKSNVIEFKIIACPEGHFIVTPPPPRLHFKNFVLTTHPPPTPRSLLEPLKIKHGRVLNLH